MGLLGTIGTIVGGYFGGPWGAAIGAGLGGGVDESQARRDARKMEQRQYDRQKEFAQMGLQWRMEDAKKAGLHPLFGMGFNGPAYSPVSVSDSRDFYSETGQHVGRALEATNPDVRARNQLENRLLISQIGETDARRDYYASEAARARQAALQTGPGPGLAPVVEGQVTGKPAGQYSSVVKDPSTVAGLHPAQSTYVVSPWGLRADLPGNPDEGVSEVLENIPIWMWPGVIAHNSNKYGDDWGRRFMAEYVFGVPPKYVPSPGYGRRVGRGVTGKW